MRISALVSCLAISLSFATAVRCFPPNEPWYPEGKAPRDKLKPWYQTIQKKIRAEKNYLSFQKQLGTNSVCYTFRINYLLHPIRTEIVTSSGSDELDKAALTLLQKVAPFSKPPVNEAFQKPSTITFSNNATSPDLSLGAPPSHSAGRFM